MAKVPSNPAPQDEGGEAPTPAQTPAEHPTRLERPRRDQRDRQLKPGRVKGGYDTKG